MDKKTVLVGIPRGCIYPSWQPVLCCGMQIELHSAALNQQTLALPHAGRPSGNRVAWLKMAPPTRGVWEMQLEVARSRSGEEFAWAGLALGAAGVLAASFWF